MFLICHSICVDCLPRHLVKAVTRTPKDLDKDSLETVYEKLKSNLDSVHNDNGCVNLSPIEKWVSREGEEGEEGDGNVEAAREHFRVSHPRS